MLSKTGRNIPERAETSFPGGRRFAFTVFDDTDGSTLENVKPVYDYLHELGIITTKSVWVLRENGLNSVASGGQTLDDPEYRSFILELLRKGFEIAFHGSRNGSTKRLELHDAIERFRDVVGHYPRTYSNHAMNRENLYWGMHRLDMWLLKVLYGLANRKRKDWFGGHVHDSEYFWGDIAQKHVTYMRNFTFKKTNILKVNPTIPYHERGKAFVRLWFSASDGHDVEAFNRLLSAKNVNRLEREQGVCIVYTHFASGFCSEGRLNPRFRELMKALSKRNGWFVPVATLLDYLVQKKGVQTIGAAERRQMELRWLWHKIRVGTS